MTATTGIFNTQRARTCGSSEQVGKPTEMNRMPIQSSEPGTPRKPTRNQLLLRQLEEQRRQQLLKRAEEDEIRQRVAEELKIRNEQRLFQLKADLERARARIRSNPAKLQNETAELGAADIPRVGSKVVSQPQEANTKCQIQEPEIAPQVEAALCERVGKFGCSFARTEQADSASFCPADQMESTFFRRTIPSSVPESFLLRGMDAEELAYVLRFPPDPGPGTLYCTADTDKVIGRETTEQLSELVDLKLGRRELYVDKGNRMKILDGKVIDTLKNFQVKELLISYDHKLEAKANEDVFNLCWTSKKAGSLPR
uniref:(northern house mosquito) hypothetical protein n=1 Tax=Culex pipiens TaxID=7175 RepID=A0A8D8KYW0_CULPI